MDKWNEIIAKSLYEALLEKIKLGGVQTEDIKTVISEFFDVSEEKLRQVEWF